MALTVDEAYLPAILTAEPMTDGEFAVLCAEHPDLFFETSAEGELIVMPPNCTLTGMRHSHILKQLMEWAETDGRGVVTDAASGFVLPNGARRSPDAAWILRSRVDSLDPQSLEGYWRICPDFVIEVRSKTDRLRVLREKMHEWIANGAQLAWMADPETRSVEIYRAQGEPQLLAEADLVRAEAPIAGFELLLPAIWNPLRRD